MSKPQSQRGAGLPDTPAEGVRESLGELFQRCYATLRALARYHLNHERVDHTLSSASLIHEVYLKLLSLESAQWRSQAHFMEVASGAMRRLLVDSARRKRALKRQAPPAPPAAGEVEAALTDAEAERLLVVEEALSRLAEVDEAAARLAGLRYFGGLSLEESAQALELSYATARRRWEFAKAWLRRTLAEQD